mmetsp:Transcript_82427/g.247212  ORF Transcript_82427/g.247212 Transcript_82427/m.247212 type:complete len:285 (+) Transcript_82427:311-1165(+)|eukprot:6637465-Prymnesium_polylepis.3
MQARCRPRLDERSAAPKAAGPAQTATRKGCPFQREGGVVSEPALLRLADAEGAQAAQRRGDLQGARARKVAEAPAGPQRLEAVRIEAHGEGLEQLTDGGVAGRHGARGECEQSLGDRAHLRVLDNLLDAGQVELRQLAEANRRAHRAGLHAVDQPRCTRAALRRRLEGWWRRRAGRRGSRSRHLGGDRLGARGDVRGGVRLEHDDGVGHVKVIAGAADDDDRGDAEVGPKGAHLGDEGADRLLIWRDERLHARVADHKVGGGGVFVDEQSRAANLERLDDGGRL